MRKILNKFLAVFVSFVMAITMIPLSGIVSHAENDGVEVGDSSNVTSVYERVYDPSKLEDGDEVIISSGTNALKADKNGNIGSQNITISSNDRISSTEDGTVWKVSGSNGSYTFENSNVTGNYKKLYLDDDGLSIGKGNTWRVNSNGRISYYYNYICYNNDSFTYTNKIWNATNLSFYKKVNRAQLTINYKYDGQIKTVKKDVALGETVDVTSDFPQKDDDVYSFKNVVYGGKEYSTTSVVVNGNAEIDVNYETATDVVKFTVNFYVNGNRQKSSSTSKSVRVNSERTVDSSKYDNNNKYTFNKMTVNGEEKDKANKFTVDKDLEVNYYYTNVDAPDAVEPDGNLDGKDQPDYPNQGAVKINKTAKGNNFDKTGIGDVELSVKGVPVKKGVDVVLVLDVSTSMNDNNRLTDAKKSAETFVNSVLGDNADGSSSNNRLGLVLFSGGVSDPGNGNEIKYGLKNSQSKDAIVKTIRDIQVKAGTDYDYAFQAANSILDSADDDRPKFIVFMTDGAPSIFTNSQGTYKWNKWDTSVFVNNVMKNPYLQGAETAKNKATVYSIGFGLTYSGTNNGFTSTQVKTILKNIASKESCSINAENATELQTAFDSIAGDIKKAGTNASVTDIIGTNYTLSYKYPISVTLHDVYTYSDYQNKKCDYKDIGKRKSTSQTVETITFSADGTQAYSDKIGSNTNIFNNGVINAKTFTYTVATRTFEWKLGKISDNTVTGDISEQEITLNYSVYLTGSIEGTRDPGTYETNESAVLSYTSYKDKTETQTFPVPKLSWKAASVNVIYYLVNDKGEPVNMAGQTIPVSYKKIVGEPKSINIKKGESKKVLAKDYLPEGYELQYPNAKFKVNHPGFDDATIESSRNEQGDLSTLTEGNAPYNDTTVYFGVLVKSDLKDDTVVLDYGKPVTIDVRANDGFQLGTLNSVSKVYDDSDVALNTGTSTNLQDGFKTEESNKYGTLKVKDSDKVLYTPTKYMDGIDKYYYAVRGSITEGDATTDVYKYSSVSIIPATSVYYEDNFSYDSKGNQTGGIYYDSELGVKVTQQSSDEQSSDNDKYGYDSSYDGNATDSDGSATEIKGNGVNVAKFTFKGTGFDLVGRTSTNSGALIIRVYNGTDTTAKPISSKLLYTKYQDGTLYQIPVYNYKCSAYGQYTVTITVQKDATFFLDAVRIYNPVDSNSEDASDANKAYDKAGESSPNIREIRNLILANGEFNKDKTGIVYIDGERNLTTSDLDLYKNEGPNNEVYLKKDQSIGFKLENLENVSTIQVGAKAPNGLTTMVAGSGTKKDSNSDLTNDLTKELNTATDMYYTLYNSKNDINPITIKDDKSAYVVITNTTGNILSLTNVKITYKNGVQTQALFMADSDVLSYTKKIAKARMKVEEPKLDLSISKVEFTSSSVKVNKDATVKVYTTKDADSILIKDSQRNKVTPKSITSETKDVVNGKTIKIFEITITPNKVGTQTYSFEAVGKDGSISDNTVNASINVKKQTILDKISSWFGI